MGMKVSKVASRTMIMESKEATFFIYVLLSCYDFYIMLLIDQKLELYLLVVLI